MAAHDQHNATAAMNIAKAWFSGCVTVHVQSESTNQLFNILISEQHDMTHLTNRRKQANQCESMLNVGLLLGYEANNNTEWLFV